MTILESIQAIGKAPALNRILEIQQRIKEIEKNFGFKVPNTNFQAVLENEMAHQTEKIKPIDEFLAENKLPPLNLNTTTNPNVSNNPNVTTNPNKTSNPNVNTNPNKTANPNVNTNPNKTANPNVNIDSNVNNNPNVNANKTNNSIKIPDTEKIEDTLYFGGIPVLKENLQAEIPNYESGSRYENSAPFLTEEMILNAARRFGVDSELVKAVATVESNLNQNARSAVGAIGVMQLMPETAESLGIDPYDERENIEGGARYLRQMLDKFNGNLQKAIAAYNAGPGSVEKYGGVPPYSETQNYVGRVLDFYIR